jgi:PAS domain S-box-containing protein
MNPEIPPRQPAGETRARRRQTPEEALRQSEERYKRLIEAVTDYVFTVRVENGRPAGTGHGAGCKAVTGYSRKDFTDDPGLWLRMVAEDDRILVTQQAEDILAGMDAREIEHRIIRKDGKIRWVKNTPVLRHDGDGRLISYDGLIKDITDRKQTEEALRESEARYRLLVETLNEGIWVIDKDAVTTYVNPKMADILGYTVEEMNGRSLFMFMDEAGKRVCEQNIERRKKGIREQHNFEFLKKDGTRIYATLETTPIKGKDGEYLGAIAGVTDITGRRQAEEALRESEERYSSLFFNNNSVSLLIDPDTGRIVDANDAAGRYYGYSRDQLRSMGICDLNRLSSDTVVRNLVRAKEEKAKHFISTHYLADGSKRYVEIYSGPIRVQGKPLFYSIIHDITDRKLAEEALRESEERYRTLIDRLPDYVIVHRDGILLYVNPVAYSHLGYNEGTLIGKRVLQFIAPECHGTAQKAREQRMAGKEFAAYEMKIVARDGSYRTVLVNGAIINFGGRPANLNVLSDITALKLAEETILRANEDLEKRVFERTEDLSNANAQLTAEISARARAEAEITRSLEEKELLLREIHHRVKNNLQIVASLLSLQSRYITDEKVLESIQDSQSRVRAMALVHERIYRSHNIAEINLREYLNYLTRQIFQFYAIRQDTTGPQHPTAIEVSIGDIMTDIDTVIPIGLIINELVTNSLKHAFPPGSNGTISIECTCEGASALRFVYHDNGTGMPAGFDWKNTESLGLRLVNSLVDQLNGTIRMGEGEGTTFIITVRKSSSGNTG